MFKKGQEPEKVDLGDTARDKITGFEGTVVAITYWINSCRRVTIQPNKLKDGQPIDNHTFDGPQVELVRKAGKKPLPEVKKTGGPSIKPASKSDPI